MPLKNRSNFLINQNSEEEGIFRVKNIVEERQREEGKKKGRVDISIHGVFEQFRIREKLACQ